MDYTQITPLLEKYEKQTQVNEFEKYGLGCNEVTSFKTGTTICGLICDGAVILASDTRVTMENIIATNAQKFSKITSQIFCTGSGSSADLQHITNWLASNMKLYELETHHKVKTTHALTILKNDLFQYMGFKEVGIIIGGYDIEGPSLYRVSSSGSILKCPYTAMGSGSLLANSVLQTEYKDDLSIEEGVKVATNAIIAGIYGDIYSGGFVDYVVITPTGFSIGKNVFDAKKAENIIDVKKKEIKTKANVIMEKITPWRDLVTITDEFVKVTE